MFRQIICVLLTLVLWSCNTTTSEEKTETIQNPTMNRSAFYGVWQAVALKVTMNSTSEIPDSMEVFEVNEQQWEKLLSVKPVLTYFYPDSTYKQEFRNINGEVYDTIKGLWNIVDERLLLLTPEAIYRYNISLKNGMSEYNTVLDWDGDGIEDDLYFSTQRLISNNPYERYRD
jgi:hypothetical protein